MKHWARIIKQWPIDRVRPEHVHFQKIMQTRAQKLSSPVTAAVDVNSKDGSVSELNETRQFNSLYALLENRFDKAYPLPEQVRHPKSNPTHYDDLLKELDEAPTRSWVTSLMNRIKGSIRLT